MDTTTEVLFESMLTINCDFIYDNSTEILIEAKRLLEEEIEWCQRDAYVFGSDDEVIAACALGAIELAAYSLTKYRHYPSQLKAQNRLAEVIPAAENDYEICHEIIPDFNDNPNTTKEDILLAFKRAIHETGYNE